MYLALPGSTCSTPVTDLSGTWLGTYWQQGLPTRFEATFVQRGNTLNGNILDDSFLGEAQVGGKVIGRSIRFTKRYLATLQTLVIYTGTLSENEDFMQGQWQISYFDSGSWEAHRGGADLMESLQTRLEKQELLTVGKKSEFTPHRHYLKIDKHHFDDTGARYGCSQVNCTPAMINATACCTCKSSICLPSIRLPGKRYCIPCRPIK